jgi:hypothetical protein
MPNRAAQLSFFIIMTVLIASGFLGRVGVEQGEPVQSWPGQRLVLTGAPGGISRGLEGLGRRGRDQFTNTCLYIVICPSRLFRAGEGLPSARPENIQLACAWPGCGFGRGQLSCW